MINTCSKHAHKSKNFMGFGVYIYILLINFTISLLHLHEFYFVVFFNLFTTKDTKCRVCIHACVHLLYDIIFVQDENHK